MEYDKFIESLTQTEPPAHLASGLLALWLDHQGDWDQAHQVVQQMDDYNSCRIHAYLHRKEGDDWNSQYWHNQAGSVFPEDLSLDEEWQQLAQQLSE